MIQLHFAKKETVRFALEYILREFSQYILLPPQFAQKHYLSKCVLSLALLDYDVLNEPVPELTFAEQL